VDWAMILQVDWMCEQIERELGPFGSGEQDTT
jgi:hypothetical protein